MGVMTKVSNGFVRIEFTDLLTLNPLKIHGSELPCLDPFFTERDLFRSPVSQRGRLVHAGILTWFRW